MTLFSKAGTRFLVAPNENIDLRDLLPVGTYTVGFDKMSGSFYLDSIESFEVKGKVYGDTNRRASRILDTFENRDNSTGVMLGGEKGSGKTLLAKKISVDGAERGIPTIVINQPWAGEGFNAFMQMIEQPVIVIFDEFEKVYDNDHQEQLLTLLDGVYPSKKLFVLTCNNKYRVNEHMKNRPGRIFYRIDYKGLDHAFIVEYCEDNLKNKDHIESVARLSVLFSAFNFDILKALVEEMNRYDETPQEAMEMLNAKPDSNDSSAFDASLFQGQQDITALLEEARWYGNPVNGAAIEHQNLEGVTDADGDPQWDITTFGTESLEKIDPATGQFVFVNTSGQRLVLTKIKESAPAWQNAF